MLIALEQSEPSFGVNVNSNHIDATQGCGQIIPQMNKREILENGGG